jgi:GDP-D-mannose 3',5'-epimerase
MIDMNDFAAVALSYENKTNLPIKHIDGPMGVRGRNSNNVLILEKLGWEPTIKIVDGLRKTYFWIKGEIEREIKEGNTTDFSKSEIVKQVDDSLMTLGNDVSVV